MTPDLSNWTVWAGIALAAALLFGGKLKPLATWAWSKVPSLSTLTAPAKPNRDKAIDSFNAAYAYLEATNCQEGMTAMLAALPHFYHPPGTHP